MKYKVLLNEAVIYENIVAPPEGKFMKVEVSFVPSTSMAVFTVVNLCHQEPINECYLYVDEFSPFLFEYQETLRRSKIDHPAAFGMSLPVSAITYHAPTRWYHSKTKVLYNNHITPSKVAGEEFVCERSDGTRFWHKSVTGCPSNSETVAGQWKGDQATKTFAMSWSENYHDANEGRVEYNPFLESCDDEWVQTNYRGRGKSSCITIHMHDRDRKSMYKRISSIPEGTTGIQVRARFFSGGYPDENLYKLE